MNKYSAALCFVCALLSFYGCSNNTQQPQLLAGFETLEPQAFSPQASSHNNVDKPQFTAKAMIKRYQAILAIHDDPQVIAKVERRIADLKMQAAEEDDFSQALEADDRQAQLNKNANAELNYTQVIAHYLKIINNNPDDSANEFSLYQLAKAYDYEAQTQKSLATLNRLITQFPETDYYDEVQFRRADIYYSLKAYEKANTLYASLTEGESIAEQEKRRRTRGLLPLRHFTALSTSWFFGDSVPLADVEGRYQ